MSVIKIDRSVLLQALSKAQIALGPSSANDQTVYFKVDVVKNLMTIMGSDNVFCSIVNAKLNVTLKDPISFTIHGHQFEKLVSSLDEGVVEITPDMENMCTKIVRGKTDMKVKSYDESAFVDIYKTYSDLKEEGEKVQAVNLIDALNYAVTFVASSEAHPELNLIEVQKGTVRATNGQILGSYDASQFEGWKKFSVNKSQVSKVVNALKLMGAAVTVDVGKKVYIIKGEGFKLFFPKSELALPPMEQVFDLVPEAFIKIDKVHLQVVLRRFGILMEGLAENLMDCEFKKEDKKTFLQISVDINGRASKDIIEVVIEGKMDLAPFQFSSAMVNKVLSAILAPVVELSFFPKANLICLKTVVCRVCVCVWLCVCVVCM